LSDLLARTEIYGSAETYVNRKIIPIFEKSQVFDPYCLPEKGFPPIGGSSFSQVASQDELAGFRPIQKLHYEAAETRKSSRPGEPHQQPIGSGIRRTSQPAVLGYLD
jgi:hypothetical protein